MRASKGKQEAIIRRVMAFFMYTVRRGARGLLKADG
jgi:hypothetical protein